MLQIEENKMCSNVQFRSLSIGDVFKYKSNYYIRMLSTTPDHNAVQLSKTVGAVTFHPDVEVYKVTATLVIK